MKKSQSILMLVGIALILVVTLIVKKIHDDNLNSAAIAAQTQSSYRVVNACSLLTKAKAQELLGPNAAPTSSSGIGAGSASVYVSICSYSNGGSVSPTGIDTISILVRAAKTPTGDNSNALVFTSQLPKNAITITGYGSRAIWDQSRGQLDVLYKHDAIYITANGSGSINSQNLLSNAEAAAKILIPAN